MPRRLPMLLSLLSLPGLLGCEVEIPRNPGAYAYGDRATRLAAKCDPADAAACDDSNPCTSDTCDADKGCQHAPADAACSDGDACTTGDACADSKCVGKTVDCDDDNVCTSDACDAATGCVATPIGGTCDDGSACTDKDACVDGACKGAPISCDDANICTDDGCDPEAAAGAQACTHTDNAATCDDADPCTEGDKCAAAACKGIAKDCSAADPCLTGQTCKAGKCEGGVAKACDDGNSCTTDSCDKASGCAFEPTSGACDDGDPCTTGEVCAAGKCGGSGPPCDDGNSCTADACDAGKGCTHSAVAAGKACDDGDPCTLTGACKDSKCVPTSYACTTDKPCHTAFCASKTGACTVKMDADGAACAANKGTCSAGACIASGANGAKWGYVPAGTFWMGCNAALDSTCNNDEKPQHQVTIAKPYWLGVDEVTTAQYAACVDAGKCMEASTYDAHCNWKKAGREQHPINCVPWSEAQGYCQWLGGALPTEAQWEMAARGRCDENGGVKGCKAAMRVYPWGNGAPTCGVHGAFSGGKSGCGDDATRSVGAESKAGVGPYGMRDMAGNVWEWVADWSGAYSAAAIVHDTGGIGPATGATRAARGGAFNSSAAEIRASSRGAGGATAPIYFVGFRCAKPAQ